MKLVYTEKCTNRKGMIVQLKDVRIGETIQLVGRTKTETLYIKQSFKWIYKRDTQGFTANQTYLSDDPKWGYYQWWGIIL